MKRNIEKIVNYILNVLIVIFSIVLLITLYNSIQLKIFKNSYSTFFGYSVFEIQTNSMANEIFADDWIIVKITKNVNIDDIITFDDEGKFLTHRVIEKYGETLVTKGDANNTKDAPIDQKQIVGKVAKILPKFGLFRKTLFDKEVLLALIGSLFIVSFIFKKDRKKNEKKNQDNKEEDEDDLLYNFDEDDKEEESYITKLTKLEEEEKIRKEKLEEQKEEDIMDVRVIEQKEEEPVEEVDNSSIVINLDEEEQKLFEKPVKKEEEPVEEKIEEEIEESEDIDNSTIQIDIDPVGESDTLEHIKEVEKLEKPVEDTVQEETITEENKKEELIEDANQEEEIEEQEDIKPTLGINYGHLETTIDLTDEERELINKLSKKDEEESEETDSSIIKVDVEEQDELPKEELKKKKKIVEEDIYKDIDQTINLEQEELGTIEQTSKTDITVYENEINRTRKEIELYKQKIQEINDKKGVVDSDIKAAKEKEIRDEEERIAQEEFERLEAKKLTHINLENLNERHKRSKNIIDKIMKLKNLKLDSYLILLNGGNDPLANEPTITEELENTYNDVMYYNYYELKENKKLNLELENKAQRLIKTYKGKDKKYDEKVNKILRYFILIAKLETCNKKNIKEKNEFYKKELIKYSKNLNWSKEMIPYLIKEFKEIQKNHIEKLENILKSLDNKTFSLELNKLNADKNMFAVNVLHNVEFDKFYSDFIINETYNSEIIKEDKMNVAISLLMTELLKDMLVGKFNKKYLLYLPSSLYKKTKKFNALMKTINDKYAVENIIITMTYETFIKNRKLIREYKKIGYKFAINIDSESEIKDKHIEAFGLMDYIFIKPIEKNVVIKKFPSDYYERVLLDDLTETLKDFEVRSEE